MKEIEWKNLCKNLNKTYRPNQFKFYNRSKEFLLSEKQIHINPGGMGLGKTLAISYLITEFEKSFNHIFISTPLSQIKNIWANEFNILGKKYMVWLSKLSVCKKKIKNPKFDLKDCDDDCEFRKDLEANKEYSPECEILLDNLILPINIIKYYQETKDNNCLLSINRCGLKKRNIIIGDYMGFIFPNMHRFITERTTENSLLIIDEAHLIPMRISTHLSNDLDLKKTIKNIREEINCEYFAINRIKEWSKLSESINIFESIKDKLINLAKTTKHNEDRYILTEFYNDWKNLSKDKDVYGLEEFRNVLEKFSKERFNVNFDYDKNPESYSAKFVVFLDNWKEKYYDKNYSQQFQYKFFEKDEIQLKIVCRNPSEYLKNIWKRWNKIIMISGTIPDKEYFKNMTGIKDYDCLFEDVVFSYGIKNDVIIYPIGNFQNKLRAKTFENNKSLLIEVLKKLKGRTLIYIQSIQDSIRLEEQLKEFKIFNFSKKENGINVDNNELPLLKNKFNNSKEGIAILHITGKVEGENYIDDDGNTANNLIIYGYPFPRHNYEYIDKLNYYKNLLKDEEMAKRYVSFFPANSTIYQACMRVKRKEEDKPIIILWGSPFSKGSPGYELTYDELKGKFVYTPEDLINEIKKKEDERKFNL